jgi:hypothetical protein
LNQQLLPNIIKLIVVSDYLIQFLNNKYQNSPYYLDDNFSLFTFLNIKESQKPNCFAFAKYETKEIAAYKH